MISSVLTGRLSKRLYSPNQVAGATFLGSPIAGCWLMAENFEEQGLTNAARQARWLGILATVALVVSSFFLPSEQPLDAALAILGVLALKTIATLKQGALFEAHINEGGLKHSNWRVVGIGLASLVLLIFAASGVLMMLPEDWFLE